MPRTYTAVVYPAVLNQDAYLTYRMDAPTDITRFVYGGRLHNYQTGSYIDYLHSLDGGVTWTRSYHFTSVSKPYDVIHYETVTGIPAGVRTVLFKFLIHNTNTTATRASGLYSVRMEVDHSPGERYAGTAGCHIALERGPRRSQHRGAKPSHRGSPSSHPSTS